MSENITVYSVKDILNMEFPKLVSIKNDAIVFHELKNYDIELNRIKTRNDLLAWIHHMTGKRNITTETIAQLIEVVCSYRKWEIYKD